MLMDTQLLVNRDLVASIKEEALFDGFFEGFLESVPQFIFQLSIILRTGVISKFFKDQIRLDVVPVVSQAKWVCCLIQK